jgi:uncharacterized membrane protein
MEDLLPDTVVGLPLHPLVVHAVVVLVPLVGLGYLVLALVPRWRATFGPLLALLATVAAAAVPVATASGENFEASLGAGGEVAEKIDQHQQWGDLVLWAVLPLWAFSVLLAVLGRMDRRGPAVTVVVILGAVAALAAIALTVLTGHSGSEAVWNPTG